MKRCLKQNSSVEAHVGPVTYSREEWWDGRRVFTGRCDACGNTVWLEVKCLSTAPPLVTATKLQWG